MSTLCWSQYSESLVTLAMIGTLFVVFYKYLDKSNSYHARIFSDDAGDERAIVVNQNALKKDHDSR